MTFSLINALRSKFEGINIQNLGMICDVNLLTNRNTFEVVRRSIKWAELYITSATYSWLARDKLISVRGKQLSYTLLRHLVHNRQLLVVYLPELYDELARRLLFQTERKISLTDLRSLLLSAYLKLPLLTIDDELFKKLSEHLNAQVILRYHSGIGVYSIFNALNLYRGMTYEIGKALSKRMDEPSIHRQVAREVVERFSTASEKTGVENPSHLNENSNWLEFKFIAWDLIPVIREYSEHRVIQQDKMEGICEAIMLPIATFAFQNPKARQHQSDRT